MLEKRTLYNVNRSDRACRVAHLSRCCMFHASLCTIQSEKFSYPLPTYCLWRCHHASSCRRFSLGL